MRGEGGLGASGRILISFLNLYNRVKGHLVHRDPAIVGSREGNVCNLISMCKLAISRF